MRDDYKDWLVAQQYAPNTQAAQLDRLRRVEDAYGDLAAHHATGTVDDVLRTLTYGAEDERQDRPNPSKLTLKGNVRKSLQSFRSAVVRYRNFLDSGDRISSGDPETSRISPVPADVDHVRQRFSLERDMQAELRRNIGKLDVTLRIIDDGAERSVATGFIDIMCENGEGEPVVVELKAGTAESRAVGQILGYMGDIAAEEPGRPVRGILVAHDFDRRVISAAKVIPNLRLARYSIKFRFEFEPAIGS